VAGIAAPILSAAPGEVVFAIPFATPDGDAIPVSVQDRGQPSAAFPIPVRAAAPSLAGPILNVDGTPNGVTTPASWGSKVTIFVTGAGPYSPPLDDGQVAPNDTSHRLQLPVSVSFLIYAGPAKGTVGLARIDIQLPPSRPVPLYFSSIEPLLTIGSITVYLPSILVQ
jgi:uncharacterized protein (TIGR03437 family)